MSTQQVRAAVLMLLLAVAGAVLWICWPQPGLTQDEIFLDALVAWKEGKISSVSAAIDQLSDDPASTDRLEVLRALLDLSRNRPDLALQRLGALPQNGRLRPLILEYTGESLYWLKRLPDAEIIFRLLADEEPENKAARLWLGAIYYDLGAFDAATVELKRFIELEPEHFAAHRLLGFIYSDFHKYGDAAKYFEQSLELAPPDDDRVEIQIELAKSLIELRRFHDALEVLNDAPNLPEAQIAAARCHWSLGNQEIAMQLVLAVREGDPTLRDAYWLHADMLADAGKFEEALLELKTATDLYPYDAELRYRMALVLEQLGRNDEAAAEIAVWEELNALSTRLTELNLIAVSDPRNAEVRDEIADVCQALGKDELARVWREAAEACRASREMLSNDEPMVPG